MRCRYESHAPHYIHCGSCKSTGKPEESEVPPAFLLLLKAPVHPRRTFVCPKMSVAAFASRHQACFRHQAVALLPILAFRGKASKAATAGWGQDTTPNGNKKILPRWALCEPPPLRCRLYLLPRSDQSSGRAVVDNAPPLFRGPLSCSGGLHERAIVRARRCRFAPHDRHAEKTEPLADGALVVEEAGQDIFGRQADVLQSLLEGRSVHFARPGSLHDANPGANLLNAEVHVTPGQQDGQVVPNPTSPPRVSLHDKATARVPGRGHELRHLFADVLHHHLHCSLHVLTLAMRKGWPCRTPGDVGFAGLGIRTMWWACAGHHDCVLQPAWGNGIRTPPTR